MEKYKRHAQLEMPPMTCYRKWKLEIEEHRGESRQRQLEKAYQQTRKGDQIERQWNTETEIVGGI